MLEVSLTQKQRGLLESNDQALINVVELADRRIRDVEIYGHIAVLEVYDGPSVLPVFSIENEDLH